MKTYPLHSVSIEDAKLKQFKFVDELTKEFSGSESNTLGDLGVQKGLNKPHTTLKAEKVIANFFNAESAVLVRGSGTGAIRFALGALLKPNDCIMLHDAPIYPTTKSSIEMMGLSQEFVDFNDDVALVKALKNTKCKVALVQLTRQKIEDSYSFEKVIEKMKTAGLLVITDDNYAVMKVEKIGCEAGGDLSCFSSFKLLGPQGIGIVVGKKKYVQSIIDIHYSGGMQVQGFESLEVLRGLTYAPVALAIQSEVNERVLKRLNGGEIKGVKNAFLANAQSKVLIVELEKPNAEKVLVEAEKLGGLPNPIGAESKFEIAPLFYRVSGTFLKADPTMKTKMIRINPNRAGDETILRILKTAIANSEEN